ncbi:MAG: hypothetical protein R6X06_08965 [Gammaproteobacteria bacterium]
MANAKKIVKASSLANTIKNATENLAAAASDGEAAASQLGSERKKLVAESKRFAKKRATLTKRKQTAASRLKKTPNADNRKALTAVSKELASVKKAGDKARAAAAANNEELKAVKTSLRQATAYLNVIEKADKVLNKPKKKRRKKRAVKKSV